MSDNGRVCCILCVCCGCGSPEQRAALAGWFEDRAGLDAASAKRAADELIGNFDLAPHGSLKAFKSAIASMARKTPQ
jgi:hypothetical protein